MEKKSLIIALALLLTLTLFVEPAVAHFKEKRIPNVDTLIQATIGDPEASDPAWAYDTSSSELIFNVYETLIFWPYEGVPAAVEDFQLMLAEEVITPTGSNPAGLPYPGIHPDAPAGTVETWYFKIRTNVPYHDPTYGTVTPADVEYSLERCMTFDHINGPAWMLYMPLALGGSYEWDADEDGVLSYAEAAVGGPIIDHFVESNETHVWFNCAISYPPFIQILAQTLASIYPQAWGQDLYDEGRFFWPGWTYTGNTGDPYSAWADFNDPTHAQLTAPTDAGGDTRMMGTGPYKFDYWAKGAYQLSWFEDYWRGWPGGGEAGYFKLYIHKLVESWPARKSMFLSNLANKQADIVDVPRASIGEVECQPGVRGVKNLPSLLDPLDMFFNYQVREDAVYFTTKPRLGADEKPDLFSDKHMRKAFAHAFDYDTFIDQTMGPAEASRKASPIIKGLAQYNATKQKYDYDMVKVVAELQLAWADASGGSAWDQGFYVPLTYNSGNEERRKACEMIAASINSIPDTHGPFTVEVYPLPWGETFLPAMRRRELTVFVAGWQADFADADNFIVPFMHPEKGTYARRQQVSYTNFEAGDFAPNSGRVDGAGNYRDWTGTVIGTFPGFDLSNDYVADLIDAAATGTPAERLAMYSELEDIYYAACASVGLAQPLVRYWERDWMQGWYYNPILGGSQSTTSDPYAKYVYHMWKGLDADIGGGVPHGGDGKVDAADITPINNYFFDAFWCIDHWEFIYGPAGEYNRIADISSPFEYKGQPRTFELDGDVIDWYSYGLIDGCALPGVDGYVNLFDIALISAQLYDYVTPY